MILDSSAVVAVVREEPGHEELERQMSKAVVVAIGAPTLVESGMVLIRNAGDSAEIAMRRFRERMDVIVVPFGEAHSQVAADAFLRFGKGRHRVALNYGDCMTYATARLAGEPLLFKGDDFARTDLAAA